MSEGVPTEESSAPELWCLPSSGQGKRYCSGVPVCGLMFTQRNCPLRGSVKAPVFLAVSLTRRSR